MSAAGPTCEAGLAYRHRQETLIARLERERDVLRRFARDLVRLDRTEPSESTFATAVSDRILVMLDELGGIEDDQ